MSNENYVRIGGGLTKDPRVFSTRSGLPMVGLTVAVNGARYDSQARQQVVTTEYISVVAFGYVAEQVEGYGLGKGDTVVVEGRLSQEEVEAPDGTKDRKTRVEAWNVVPVRVRGGAHPTPAPTRGPAAPGGPPPTDPWGPAYDEAPF